MSLLVAAGLLASGCASKYARFRHVAVAEGDPKQAFETTEEVLSRYFASMETRLPAQGLLTTDKSMVAFGELPKDQYRLFATAVVEPLEGGSLVRLKVQRTQIVGRWTWLGLGVTFYEREVFAGSDEPLADKVEADLTAALGKYTVAAQETPEPAMGTTGAAAEQPAGEAQPEPAVE